MSRRLRSLVVVTALVVVAGCTGPGDSGEQTPDAGFISGTGTVTKYQPAERKSAPALSGTDLDGKQVSLDDYKGKVVVLNVWGSWCPPCREEASDLEAASKALAGKGVAFLGINNRDTNIIPAQRFIANRKITYPSIYDPDGRLLLGFRDTVPPKAIPTTLFIDDKGRIAARILGPATRTTFEQLALDVVAGK